VTSQGHAYARFRRAVDTGNLRMIRAAALELPRVGLPDALEIVLALGREGDRDYERACLRWLGRFCLEAKRATREDVDQALECFDHIAAGSTERGRGGLDSLCRAHRLV
jgi:hypothetical protein